MLLCDGPVANRAYVKVFWGTPYRNHLAYVLEDFREQLMSYTVLNHN
jgi:hypothetical protein